MIYIIWARLFFLPFLVLITPSRSTSSTLWHNRLGSPSHDCLQSLHKHQLVTGFPIPGLQPPGGPCPSCMYSKQPRTLFPNMSTPPTTKPIALINSYLSGRINPRTFSRFKYYITFIKMISLSLVAFAYSMTNLSALKHLRLSML